MPGIPRQESLVRIRGIDRARPGAAIGREFSYPEYREYAAQRTLFSAVAAWTSSDIVFDAGTREANPQSGAATYVTGNYFQVLGLRPALGAGLPVDANDADSAPPLVAVISHVLWERHFERSPDVIGRAMKVNGVTVTIVGVAPRRFAGARTGGSQMRVWLPLSARPQLQRTASTLASYDDARFGLAARLQPGVRADQTGPIVQAIAERAEQQTTISRATVVSADVVRLLAGNYFPPSGADEGPSAGPAIGLMFPVLILLITCTNVSALLAGLGVARRREIAVRLALGAARRRIVRQLVTETVLLATAAGALGLFVIWLLLRLFDASIPDLAIEIDWRSIAFTFSLALVAGVLFGFSPALHATRLGLQEALKDSAGVVVARRLRLQSWLVVAQIAFTQPALLAMGALVLQMRSDLRQLPAQPYADRIVELRFNVNPRYGPLDDDRERTLARLEERLAAVPGVEGVVAAGEHRFVRRRGPSCRRRRRAGAGGSAAGSRDRGPARLLPAHGPLVRARPRLRRGRTQLHARPGRRNRRGRHHHRQRPGTPAVGRRRSDRPAPGLGWPQCARRPDVHHRRRCGRCDHRRARPGAAPAPSPGHR